MIEHPSIKNVIILQTVLDEVKHRSAPVYKRIKDVIGTSSKHFFTFVNEFHKYEPLIQSSDLLHKNSSIEILSRLKESIYRFL